MPPKLSHLPRLLLSVLEKYERGQEDYDMLLDTAEIDWKESLADDEVEKRVLTGQKAAESELRTKIFDRTEGTNALFSELSNEKSAITRSITIDEIRKAVEEQRTRQQEKTASAEIEGPSPQTAGDTQPDLGLQFAKEFALNLDKLVWRVEGLDRLNDEEILDTNLRELLREAHRCFLHGFDYASAILCGAILEQALRTALTCEAKLEESSWEALQQGLLSEEQYRMANEVRELRNDAAHNPAHFRQYSDTVRASVLSNTRAVLVALNPLLGMH
jgi:hypothetical protein